MSFVKNGDTVIISCRALLQDGRTFTDSSVDGPIEFIVGKYEIIKGLNSYVLDMKEGEEKTFTLNPSEAYGEYEEEKLVKVSLQDLPRNISRGMQLESLNLDNTKVLWRVRDIYHLEGFALLDSNHLLAGLSIDFQIKILKVE